SDAWDAVVGFVVRGVADVVSRVVGLKDRIVGFFSGAKDWLLDAGKAIIAGLISGITAGFRRVKDKLGELTSLLPDWKGPLPTDRKLLVPQGEAIIQGLVRGFENQFSTARTALSSFTSSLAGPGAAPVVAGATVGRRV